ncbi:hypothetical protein KP509_1Z042700 [Ceratopteris richardii]|nr:hypothetical protein KP509_1Z042700 [Ceratopteris richardii]
MWEAYQISKAGCSLVSAACTTHTVKSGDTCYAVSQSHGISLSYFQSSNPGINCNNLQIGQVVCVSQPTRSSSPPSGSSTTYIVKSGNTCYAISQANGISLSNFHSWNSGINCKNLQIGQVVCVSQPTSNSSPPSGSCTTYIVKSGDTCYAISQVNGISLSNLESWNSGINCNNLQIGQVVCVSEPTSSSNPPSGSYTIYTVKSGTPVMPSQRQMGYLFQISRAGTPQSAAITFKLARKSAFRSLQDDRPQYIGALYNGVKFTDVPINTGVTFHFILAFAIDYTSSASPTNGLFNIYRQNSVLTPATVQSIKSQYSNVKVMLSLGGDTMSGQLVQFRATSVNSWLSNAVSSLTSLITQYHLDGIDIDYEHFDSVSTHTFVSCIGQLVQQLKSSGVISVASIAPFDGVQTQYKALWVIDLVNFQFYSYPSSTSASQFVSYYNTAAATYGGGAKVLASFSTGGVGPAPSTALSAIQQLKSNGKLPGIFIFSADGSYAASSFQYEQQAQTLLAG